MRKRGNRLLLILIVLGGLLSANGVFAQQSTTENAPAATTTTTASTPVSAEQAASSPVSTDPLYQIGPGDVLDVIVSKQPDYSLTGVRVDNWGMIQIARDDEELKAACRTVREVASEIKARYKKYLRNPYVYVAVKEFNSQPVAVTGAVHAPGRFQLQRRVHLLELLTYVNGPNDRASDKVQIIHAAHNSLCEPSAAASDLQESVTSYDLDATLRADEKANPVVHPGDIVRIPEAAQAFLLGSVRNPAPIDIKRPLTLSQAVAVAGGLLPDANGEKIRVLRQLPGSTQKTEIIASLKMINQRKAEDIFLQANDIVEVPGPSGGKKILNTMMQSLVPMAIRLPLWVIR